ncbi:hypothetical protein HAX54_034101, partial [Datura stramonium]|nr:hypothetical protein [Datura stramonium]
MADMTVWGLSSDCSVYIASLDPISSDILTVSPLLQQAPSSGKPPATQQSRIPTPVKHIGNFKDGRSKDRHDDERRKHVKKGGIRETNSKKRASE